MLSANDCLRDLERLAQEDSSDTRREMLRKITDLFFATKDRQEAADTDIFGTALDRLAYALEAEARIELANRLSDASIAPHDLLVRLASDQIDIARPLLEKSVCLSDDDLETIANSSSQDHLMAMTVREELSSSITDVIVKRGDENVLQSVVKNKGASFSEQGFDILSDRSAESEAVRNALSVRNDVPDDFFKIVKAKISQKLARVMEENNIGISSDDVASVVNDAAKHVTEAENPEDSLRKKFEERHQKAPFDESEIINFARARRVDECIHVLSLLSKLDHQMIQHCLLEADLAALGILCKASDFKDATFAALLQMRLTIKGMQSNLAISEMKRYNSLTTESAQRVLRFLKVRLAAQSR